MVKFLEDEWIATPSSSSTHLPPHKRANCSTKPTTFSRRLVVASSPIDPRPSDQPSSSSSSSPSSSSSSSTSFLNLHFRPHSAHLHSDPETHLASAANFAVGEIGGADTGLGGIPEEHEYEALPLGAGWGVNMAAGAMVCSLSTVHQTELTIPLM